MAKELGKADAAPAADQNQAIGEQKPAHKAEAVENADGVVFRAPGGVHVKDLGHIVQGTFHGSLDTKEGKKHWRVLHGCPARGLPSSVLESISESDPTAIAPWAPPPPDAVR